MPQDYPSLLGIQSFCFRGLKGHDEVIQALHDCGVRNVELSAGHLNPAGDMDCRAILKKYREAGIDLPTFGVHSIGPDAAKARPLFEFAAHAGVSVIGVTFAPGGIETAETLCREFGINVAIHNHGRKDRIGSLAALTEIFDKTSSRIGLCLDTAWMLDSGEDPVEVARKFYPRLYSLHLKDFVFDRAGKPRDVIIGEGNLSIEVLATLLVNERFSGPVIIEYEGDVNNPVPATRQCVEAVRAAFKKVAQRKGS